MLTLIVIGYISDVVEKIPPKLSIRDIAVQQARIMTGLYAFLGTR